MIVSRMLRNAPVSGSSGSWRTYYVTFMRKASCKVPRLEFKLSSGLCNHQHKIQEQHLHHCRIRLQETIKDVKVCFQILIRHPSGIHTLRKGATLPCPRCFCHAWFMKTSKAGSSSGSQTSCLSNLGSNPRRDPTFPDVYTSTYHHLSSPIHIHHPK